MERIDSLLSQSKFKEKEKQAFKEVLERRLAQDNHDIALNEKLSIISHCFDKNVDSVVMQMPDLEELYLFKKCVRKFSRVKMRAIQYYHYGLHKDEDPIERAANLLKFYNQS